MMERSYGNQGSSLNAIKLRYGKISEAKKERTAPIIQQIDCITCRKEETGIPTHIPMCKLICKSK